MLLFVAFWTMDFLIKPFRSSVDGKFSTTSLTLLLMWTVIGSSKLINDSLSTILTWSAVIAAGIFLVAAMRFIWEDKRHTIWARVKPAGLPEEVTADLASN